MVAQRIEQGMFADSLLESSWAQRSRRSWTTLTSFGLEALAIGVLLVLPLWKTVGMPSAHALSTPITMMRVAPTPAVAPSRGGSTSAHATNFVIPRFVQPGHIPTGIHSGPDDPAPEPSGPGDPDLGPIASGPGIPGLFSTGGTMPVAPPAPAPVVHRVRISVMQEGNIINRVQPVYPPLARSARIQGPVVLVAIISKAGIIENLRVLSGHPMLVPAAIDAVSRWRYRPYILNSEPVEVETQVTVNFTLGGS